MSEQSHLSTFYLKIPVKAFINGALYNPTNDTVYIAVVAEDQLPAGGDWNLATWEIDGNTYLARLLIGPVGGLNLSAGYYDQWVKVVDNPEIPVEKAPGTLIIT